MTIRPLLLAARQRLASLPWCAAALLAPAQAAPLPWQPQPLPGGAPDAAAAPGLQWQVQPTGPSAATAPTSGGLRWQAAPPPPGPAAASPAAPSLAWEPVPPDQLLLVTGADATPGRPDQQTADQQTADPQPDEPQPRPTLAHPTETDPTAGGRRIASPYIGGGLPSAYNASGGDYFIAGSAGTPGKLRDGSPDGAVNLGFGIGNPYNLVSLELGVNFGSTKLFAANGGLDASLSRVLVTKPRFELAIGGGYLGFYSYGTEGTDTPNGYGVVTMSTVLNYGDTDFPQILQFSVGVGGNRFAYLDADTFEGPTSSPFAAIGVELNHHVGASIGWSGRGINAAVSYVPFPRSLPISINLLGSDMADTSPFGRVGVLSVAWGGNLMRDLGYTDW